MKLLDYDQKPKEYDNFDKEIKNYLQGNLKPKPIMGFKNSDFEIIKKKLKKLAEDDSLKKFGLSERSAQLLNMLPVVPLDNIFQPNEEAEPSDFEKMKFISLVNLVSDPYIVINNLADGTLTFRDIDNLGVYYPDILEALTYAVLEQTSEYLAKNDFTTMSTRQTLDLSKILGISKLTPSRLKKYQESFKKPEPAQQNQGQNINIPMDSIATGLTATVQNG